jgi:hypothetical protein
MFRWVFFADGRAMDYVVVLHILLDPGEVEGSLDDDDSNAMKRLRDGMVKFGKPKHEHCVGQSKTNDESVRNLYCEHPKLLNVLDIRSEHLWIIPCPKMMIFRLITNLSLLNISFQLSRSQ